MKTMNSAEVVGILSYIKAGRTEKEVAAIDHAIKTVNIVERFSERVCAGCEKVAIPKGTWNFTQYSEVLEGGGSLRVSAYRCSVCQKDIPFHGGTKDFCPNCGADMRGTENETI